MTIDEWSDRIMGKRSKKDISTSDHGINNDSCAEMSNYDDKTAAQAQVIIVIPGDNVTSRLSPSPLPSPQVKQNRDNNSTTTTPVIRYTLGDGLRYNPRSKQIYATQPGRLVHQYSNNNRSSSTGSSTYYVEPHRTNSSAQRRYRPSIHDRIVGIVVDRVGTTDEGGGDIYRIDVHAAQYGMLSNLQFMGATKRNKPILQAGQIVYCRVMNDTNIDTDEPLLLSCMNGPNDIGSPNKDWTTNEGCYGELRNGGTICCISMQLARDILTATATEVHHHHHNIILEELGKHSKKIPFEIAVGMNGYLWLNSTQPEYVIMLQNAIQNSHVLTTEQIRVMVKNLIYIVDKQSQQRNDSS